jgi:RimJ/RimL family protein N-acetyltransferase
MSRYGQRQESVTVKLLPLDTPDLIELVASWLARKENYQWLDFGGGRQVVTPALLKVMTQRESHFMRVYTDEDDAPIGIAGLNSVDRTFKTATLWGATGEKSFRSRGYATFAGSMFLTLAFRDLGLRAINTWVVENNPSLRLVQRLGFRPIGRQRLCHYIDDRVYDRLFFDLLATEHLQLEQSRPHRIEPAAAEASQKEDRAAHV